MIREIKQIVDNYLNHKKLPAVLIGTYTGTDLQVSETFRIPASLLSGNLKEKLRSGDRLRVLAGTGWKEFLILEIIGRPSALKEEIIPEALK